MGPITRLRFGLLGLGFALASTSCFVLAVDEVAGPDELDEQVTLYILDSGGSWAHERTIQYELRNRGNDTIAVDTTTFSTRTYQFSGDRDGTGNYNTGSRAEEDGSTESFRWLAAFFGPRIRLDIGITAEPVPGSADESYFVEVWEGGRLVFWHQPRGSSSLEGQRHFWRRR